MRNSHRRRLVAGHVDHFSGTGGILVGRIECETAAQCAQIEEAMMGVIEPVIFVSVIAAVAFAVGWNAHMVVKDRE